MGRLGSWGGFLYLFILLGGEGGVKQNIIYPRKIGSYPGERIKKLHSKRRSSRLGKKGGGRKGGFQVCFSLH